MHGAIYLVCADYKSSCRYKQFTMGIIPEVPHFIVLVLDPLEQKTIYSSLLFQYYIFNLMKIVTSVLSMRHNMSEISHTYLIPDIFTFILRMMKIQLCNNYDHSYSFIHHCIILFQWWNDEMRHFQDWIQHIETPFSYRLHTFATCRQKKVSSSEIEPYIENSIIVNWNRNRQLIMDNGYPRN